MRASKAIVALALLALTALIDCAPLQKDLKSLEDPELTEGYFEGDIILDNYLRNGHRNPSYRWPNNIVYYRIVEGYFDEEHINHIKRGMRNIEAVSCVRFIEATTDQPYYVNITGEDGGCYSSVGFLNRVQTYNLQVYPLDSGCFRIGTIMHEFLHTLGFYHMQSSAERDDYVRIADENIRPESLHNFNKYDENFIDAYDEVYDYGSVLHYSAFAFSKNGEMTIIPLKQEDAAGVMGQRREMSKGDINRLNTMYRCPLDA